MKEAGERAVLLLLLGVEADRHELEPGPAVAVDDRPALGREGAGHERDAATGVETIRYTLRQFDRDHPDLAIFPEHSGPLREETKSLILGGTAARLLGLAEAPAHDPAMAPEAKA